MIKCNNIKELKESRTEFNVQEKEEEKSAILLDENEKKIH